MSDQSQIEWTDATWNPIGGCSKASPGCQNCYAMRQAIRIPAYRENGLVKSTSHGPQWTGQLKLFEKHLFDPLRWQRPRRIFVNSMSDLFHDSVPYQLVNRLLAIMAVAKQHTFQVLTKRADRMADHLNGTWHRSQIEALTKMFRTERDFRIDHHSYEWPLPNVWLGVSVENQEWADKRIPDLLDTPAAVRFLSCEPLLGPIDLSDVCRYGREPTTSRVARRALERGSVNERIDWVIAGGESQPGARPCHPDWVRGLRDQCQANGVPFFFKQWGDWVQGDAIPGGDLGGDFRRGNATILAGDGSPNDGHFRRDRRDVIMRRVGKKRAGRLLDGRTWDEYPEAVACDSW